MSSYFCPLKIVVRFLRIIARGQKKKKIKLEYSTLF